ncbi:MAG: DNA-binding protein [Candidatus Micrarchaeota archaeon]|nr:DNA-binding protein [Candidatus Micrarchaeota archaeon]
MQSRKEKSGYWLILEQGEEVKSSISNWAREHKITGAQVWGIGAITDVELAYYSPQAKKWKTRRFPGENYEMLSCIGNISEDGLHAHISMSDARFNVHGGHLIGAEISVMGEFFILPTTKLGKKPLPKLGLRGISLEK